MFDNMTRTIDMIAPTIYTGEALLSDARSASLADIEVQGLKTVLRSEVEQIDTLREEVLDGSTSGNPEIPSLLRNVSEEALLEIGTRSVMSFVREQQIKEASDRRNSLASKLSSMVLDHYLGRPFHIESLYPDKSPIQEILYGNRSSRLFNRSPLYPESVTAKIWFYRSGTVHAYTGKSVRQSKHDYQIQLVDSEANPLVSISEV
jgi:hypothetical protein